MTPGNEIELLADLFDNTEIVIDTIKQETIIRCSKSFDKHCVGFNDYRILVLLNGNIIIVQGHQLKNPYEYRYFYENLKHLEEIIKEVHLQNCLYFREENKS